MNSATSSAAAGVLPEARRAGISSVIAVIAALMALLLLKAPLMSLGFAAILIVAGSFLLFDPLLYLAIFLLPLAPMIELDGIPLHDWASFSRVLIFVGVMARSVVEGDSLREWLWKGRFAQWMLLYFAVAIATAAVVHPLEGGAARSLFRLASYVLFYYAVAGWIKDAARLRKAVTALLVSTIAVCLLALLQAAQGSFGEWFERLYANQSEIIPPWTGRVSSVFLGVNFLAGYLNMVLPLALAVQVMAKEAQLQIAARTCFFLGVITLVLTQSRGAYIALLAVLVMAFQTVLKSKTVRLRFVTAFVAAVIIGSVISYALTQDIDTGAAGPSTRERFTTVDETTAERWLIYGAAWGMFVESPATGIGYGNFRSRFNSFTGDAPTDLWDAHCLYLKVLAETGLPGFVCFFALIGSALVAARRSWKESSWLMERILAVALVGGVTTVLVQGMVESLVDLPQFGSLLWLLFALYFAGRRIGQSGPSLLGSAEI
ncbi:MAG TPA: O-antigen ligase family protein [Candidatus Angelobacter sp.]